MIKTTDIEPDVEMDSVKRKIYYDLLTQPKSEVVRFSGIRVRDELEMLMWVDIGDSIVAIMEAVRWEISHTGKRHHSLWLDKKILNVDPTN